MQELLAWAAIATATGVLITIIKFWIDIGRTQQRVEDISEAQRLAIARNDLLSSALTEFKVEAARLYATAKELHDAEAQLGRGVELAIQGVNSRLDSMTQRLDSLLLIARSNGHQPPL